MRGARCLAGPHLYCLASSDRAVGAAEAMKSWARRFAQASSPATGPMAPGGCGTTCWRRACRVDCARIERLKWLQALRARPRRRRLPPDLGQRQAGAVAPNVLDRSFEAPATNRKWIADFTYVWTAEGWLYVAAVVDLFSRRVVGWSMSTAMTAQFVTDALVMAIWRRGKPDALLHHSDRGSQYTSEQFQKLMADHGVICSMSRSGNVWDNAAMESFFSSLKTERTARKTYRTRDEAKADVFDYIECFYNPKRRHSTIGYLSPVEFEMQAGLA